MKFWAKKIEKPTDSTPVMIEAVQLWFVTWEIRESYLLSDKYTEAFTSEETARSYAEDLRRAAKVLQYRWDLNLQIKMKNN